MQIIITSRSKAGRIIKSTSKGGHITHIVSIGTHERDQRIPTGNMYHPAKKIRLIFDDVTWAHDGCTPPNEEHARQLIDFFNRMENPANAAVLFHCYAGVSRSTAAAYILIAMCLGPGREVDAYRKLLEIAPWATPNRKLVELADELLERDGAMVECLIE